MCRPTEFDAHLFREGTHRRPWEKFGAHRAAREGADGCFFSVFAPAVERVSVVGDWNGWREDADVLEPLGDTGVHVGFVAGVEPGARYKFRIRSRFHGYRADKADPFGRRSEGPPGMASVVWEPAYRFRCERWESERASRQHAGAPISIYEVHLGSWRRRPDGSFLGYVEAAEQLADYVRDLGFTHVELLPILEHPFYGTWGYGATGYYAPTARYGSPDELMALVDILHEAGLGVILDWVPAHFPADECGLAFFDGTWLYEHEDPRRGHHPQWDTRIFDYGRGHVRSFLIGSALYWLEVFRFDGLRVDAVASMLYLDFARPDGQWLPNEQGGRENWDAVSFLRELTDTVRRLLPDRILIAEESSAWPGVTAPTSEGGLGFHWKWDMGWMHDTLGYFQVDPLFRKHHHEQLTFRRLYAHTERFLLPLSHDEVVHGKGSLIGRMPGDDWRRFAQLRLLLAWQIACDGKKLLFMGGEFGQWREWNHDASLDWHLLEKAEHRGVRDCERELLGLYRRTAALHERDADATGFEWVDCHDADHGVVSFLRWDRGGRCVLCVFHFTPVPRPGYRVGVPFAGAWRLLLDTDDARFGGSGLGPKGEVASEPVPWQGRPASIVIDMPPFGALFFGMPSS